MHICMHSVHITVATELLILFETDSRDAKTWGMQCAPIKTLKLGMKSIIGIMCTYNVPVSMCVRRHEIVYSVHGWFEARCVQRNAHVTSIYIYFIINLWKHSFIDFHSHVIRLTQKQFVLLRRKCEINSVWNVPRASRKSGNRRETLNRYNIPMWCVEIATAGFSPRIGEIEEELEETACRKAREKARFQAPFF